MAITIDDFNKIWASTSPLTPYTFSESNYKEGWNFVGSTPPSRQMWDSIQKSNDEKSKYLLDNFADYLPIAGGTMVGAIVGNPLTLSADDGNDSADLVLKPNGSATWDGKEVERVNASGSNYIRYESGLQIVFDTVQSVTTTAKSVTYPVPFATNPKVITSANNYHVSYRSNISLTGFDIKTDISTGAACSYIAIGYWK